MAEVPQDAADVEVQPWRRSPKTAETWKKNHGGGPPKTAETWDIGHGEGPPPVDGPSMGTG
jgi:hypothetical protein